MKAFFFLGSVAPLALPPAELLVLHFYCLEKGVTQRNTRGNFTHLLIHYFHKYLLSTIPRKTLSQLLKIIFIFRGLYILVRSQGTKVLKRLADENAVDSNETRRTEESETGWYPLLLSFKSWGMSLKKKNLEAIFRQRLFFSSPRWDEVCSGEKKENERCRGNEKNLKLVGNWESTLGPTPLSFLSPKKTEVWDLEPVPGRAS